MLNGKKIVVIMPAYNAEKTLKKTFDEIPHEIVDEVILTDDGSLDKTVAVSKMLNIKTFMHEKNRGYGANQKTCYEQALKAGADIAVMLHPDYQYKPSLIGEMSELIANGTYDIVLGSRILGGDALKRNMPLYKYLSNRVFTFIENVMIGENLSEYHTGYRAFSKEVLKTLPILENSDDFVFDNQILLQALYFKFRIGEISCPASFNKDASTISLRKSIKYGWEILAAICKYMLVKHNLAKSSMFNESGRKLV